MELTLNEKAYLPQLVIFANLVSDTVNEAFSNFRDAGPKRINAISDELLQIAQGQRPMLCAGGPVNPLASFLLADGTLCLPDDKIEIVLAPDGWDEFESALAGFVYDRIRQRLKDVPNKQYLTWRTSIDDVVWQFCTALDGSAVLELDDDTRYRPVLGFADNAPSKRTKYFTPSDIEFLFFHESAGSWSDDHFRELEAK